MSSTKTKVETALSASLTVAAIVMAAALVKREFFPTAPAKREARYEREWRNALAVGRPVGTIGDRVSIVAFSDFECPFCEKLHESVRRLQQKYPKEVSYTFVHFPLEGHKFAMPAAISAECAAELGRFSNAVDMLFASQRTLGERPWLDYVGPVSKQDSTKARACLASKASDSSSLIQRARAQGSAFRVTGTPAVFVNGWRYVGMPSDSELTRTVQDIIDGKVPYPRFPKEALVLR